MRNGKWECGNADKRTHTHIYIYSRIELKKEMGRDRTWEWE